MLAPFVGPGAARHRHAGVNRQRGVAVGGLSGESFAGPARHLLAIVTGGVHPICRLWVDGVLSSAGSPGECRAFWYNRRTHAQDRVGC